MMSDIEIYRIVMMVVLVFVAILSFLLNPRDR
jgi:hypothetical protein